MWFSATLSKQIRADLSPYFRLTTAGRAENENGKSR